VPDSRPTPRPLDSPEEARQLDRYYMIGLVCMLALIVAFPAYKMGEPARREATQEAMRAENIAIGETMFAQHCASCHGDDARGGRGFPTLGAKEFLTSVSDRQLQWLISGGIPGSPMTAYDIDLGGPFTSQEIARLVAYLRSMEEGAPSVAGWYKGEAAPPRERRVHRGGGDDRARERDADTHVDRPALASDSLRGSRQGDVAVGGYRELEQVFASRCAACHGAVGEGTPIAKRVRPLSDVLAANPDSAFGVIARGVAGTAMMPFGKAHGGPLDETTIRALVEWFRQAPPSPSP
jgi:mono/diheme cytochrome c family protein